MKYLIPFDFSPVSKNAVQQALKFVATSGGEISILHIVNDKELVRNKEIQLKAFIATLKQSATIHVRGHVVLGDVFDDIGKMAKYHGTDLVIMGTHGVDAWQKLFGSNAVKIIKNSSVPFFVFQENYEFKKIKKIVMPFSIETRSMQVLRFAVEISKMYKAEIHIIGRAHSDEFLKHKEHSNIILADNFLKESKIKHHFEIVETSESDFQDQILNYASIINADLIAATYYSDSVLPMFEKFVQNLIVNRNNIPVLCLNAKSLLKIDSTLSFMTI